MLSTAAGIRTIDPQFILAARSMGATLPQLVRRVIIPASVPTVFTALRLGGALTIIGVVVSEMLTSAAGIGYLVTLNRTILDSPRVFAAILMILILAVAYYMLARAIERRMVVWQSAGRRQQAAATDRAGRGLTRPDRNATKQKRSITDAPAPLADHRHRQLPAAGLAGEPRDAVEGGAAHAPQGDLAHPRAVARAGAGRRHRAGDPRHG